MAKEMTFEELNKMADMQKEIARYCREGKLYGIHSWGIHISVDAYEKLFGEINPVEGEERHSTVFKNSDGNYVEVFCILKENKR